MEKRRLEHGSYNTLLTCVEQLCSARSCTVKFMHTALLNPFNNTQVRGRDTDRKVAASSRGIRAA